MDLLSSKFDKQRWNILGGHASIAHGHAPKGMMMVPKGKARIVSDAQIGEGHVPPKPSQNSCCSNTSCQLMVLSRCLLSLLLPLPLFVPLTHDDRRFGDSKSFCSMLRSKFG